MKLTMRTISVVTSSGGAYSSEPVPLNGLLMRVSYKPSGSPLDAGADLTITESNTGLTLYSQANIGTSAFTKLPRKPISSSVDGADSTTVFDLIPIVDRITLTIANGGNALSGTFYIVCGE